MIITFSGLLSFVHFFFFHQRKTNFLATTTDLLPLGFWLLFCLFVMMTVWFILFLFRTRFVFIFIIRDFDGDVLFVGWLLHLAPLSCLRLRYDKCWSYTFG